MQQKTTRPGRPVFPVQNRVSPAGVQRRGPSGVERGVEPSDQAVGAAAAARLFPDHDTHFHATRPMPTVAEMIDALRQRGMNQTRLADRLGVSQGLISAWKTGRSQPGADKLRLLEQIHSGGSNVADPPPAGGQPALPAASLSPDAAPPFDVPALLDSPPATAALPRRRAEVIPRQAGEAFRFIHCADLHLDSPLRGLERYEGAPVEAIRTASRRAFERLVQCAIDNQVAFVVIAGDIYDRDWPSANTGFFFLKQLARLTQHGIHTYAVSGNHDSASEISRHLDWPVGTTLFRADRAHSMEVPACGVVIHGRSFANRHEDATFLDSYPPAVPNRFNLGILHTSLSGNPNHAEYVPCSPAQLIDRGYHYWALGHVHTPAVVHDSPAIVYPGNIQGRSVKETGPRGCYLVTVAGDQRATPHFVPLDDVRWHVLTLDCSEATSVSELVGDATETLRELVASEDFPVAVRLELAGHTPLHRELAAMGDALRDRLVNAANTATAGMAWLEKVVLRTAIPETGASPGPIAHAALDAIRAELAATTPAQIPEITRLLRQSLGTIGTVDPDELRRLQAEEFLAAALRQAEDILMHDLYAKQSETDEN